MRLHVDWDERYPSLCISKDQDYTWGTYIDLPEEDFKKWNEAWTTVYDIEDKVKELESRSRH